MDLVIKRNSQDMLIWLLNNFCVQANLANFTECFHSEAKVSYSPRFSLLFKPNYITARFYCYIICTQPWKSTFNGCSAADAQLVKLTA